MSRTRSLVVPEVISPPGRRAIWITGVLRLGAGVAAASTIVAIGQLFAGINAVVLVIAGIAACGVLTFAEYAVGGIHARREERRVRHALLERQFSIGAGGSRAAAQFPPGRVIQMLTDGVERLTNFTHLYWGSTLASMALPMVILGYIAIAIDAVVGLTVLVAVPLIPVAVFGFLRLFRSTSANSRRARAALSGRYLDAIRNLVTIKMLGAGDRVEAELRAAGERNRRAIMRLLAGNQLVIIVLDGIFSLVLICATAFTLVIRADHLSAADALTIMALTVLLLEPLQQVAGFFYIGMGGMAAARDIRKYLESASDWSHSKVMDNPAATASTAMIDVRGVSYAYDRQVVLSDIELSVPRGGRLAIVGESGAGKSTVMRLLGGTLPMQGGHIMLDGNSLSGADLATVRALSATVGQSTWLFTGTIADNLRLAAPEADDDQLWEALRAAQVADEIAGMPRGLDTYLGEGANLVSGGQAQRISLARALLSGRKILLLDEPTSHVDLESERAIIDAIAALPSELTIVMVTHRPSLLRLADTVLTLDNGRITTRQESNV